MENQLVVNVVNRHEEEDMDTSIELQTGNDKGKAIIHLINAGLDGRNTRAEQPIHIVLSEISFKDHTINHTFPAHSFTQMIIPVN